MKVKIIGTLIGVCLLTVVRAMPSMGEMSSPSYQVITHVFDGGGSSSYSARFHLIGSTGQSTPIGSSQSSRFLFQSGFIPQVLLNEEFLTQLSADEYCQPKDMFETSAGNLEAVYVAGTLSVPLGKYNFYLIKSKAQWLNGDDICSAGCAASKLIDIDSSGNFCGLLWTPPGGDNNDYDIILDLNGNAYFDLGIDFLDSSLSMGVKTLIELLSFTAASNTSISGSGQITLKWTTASELDNAGFNLWRSETANGQYIKINSRIIEAEGGATLKAEYAYSDNTAKAGVRYYYKLEDIDTRGNSTFHGSVSAFDSSN